VTHEREKLIVKVSILLPCIINPKHKERKKKSISLIIFGKILNEIANHDLCSLGLRILPQPIDYRIILV
jgi:hypothetical protein